MGIATILVIAVAVIGSLTVLPAVLAALGDKLEKGRLPFIGRRQSQARESRMWGWMTDRVMRRPMLAIVVAGGALVALADPRARHADQAARHRVLRQVPARHPDVPEGPEGVPGRGRLRHGRRQGRRRQRAGRQDRASPASKPTNVEINPAGTVARSDVALAGSGVDDKAMKSLEHLREDVIPAAFARRPRHGGRDRRRRRHGRLQRSVMHDQTPIVFAFVLGLAFLLLLATFRSIVIPIKAILLNLLSVGASYGLLKLVFQDGHGEKLLGFESNGASSPGCRCSCS